MSNAHITLAYALDLPPGVKAVLVALVGRANDTGYCFPSRALGN